MYEVHTSESDPFHVDFLPDDEVNLPGRIGIAGAPGRKDPRAPEGPQNRDLDSDLARLVDRYGTEVLVCLLERGEFVRDEMEELCISELMARAMRMGVQTDWTPLPGGDVPVNIDTVFLLVERIISECRNGRVVVIHGRDGLGRAGLVGGCCLVALGTSVSEALSILEEIRPGQRQSAAHKQTLQAFDELWRKRALERSNPSAVSDLLEPDVHGASGPWRISQTGIVPMSQVGAAALVFLGVDEDAVNAGVGDGSPLRTGDVFHVMPGKVLWLGRGTECDVSIPSGQLSRRHAMIAFVPVAEGQLVLADLDSRNGTWVGEEQTSVSFLGLGDEFTLARAFRFRYDGLG